MTLEDRELLELAAKAAGMKIHTKNQAERDEMGFGDKGLWIVGGSSGWNPLTDDGDAMRLAVKLRIDVSHDEIGMRSFVYARAEYADKHHFGISEVFDYDSERNWRTRRAIVRASAEIGKVMG